jgi:hypothetical protein
MFEHLSAQLRFTLSTMITEKQVDHVIIPIVHDYLVIVGPNAVILSLTFIFIIVYQRRSAAMKRTIDDEHTRDELHLLATLFNGNWNSSATSAIAHRTRSFTSFRLFPIELRSSRINVGSSRYSVASVNACHRTRCSGSCSFDDIARR